jgi:hypothetical protein
MFQSRLNLSLCNDPPRIKEAGPDVFILKKGIMFDDFTCGTAGGLHAPNMFHCRRRPRIIGLPSKMPGFAVILASNSCSSFPVMIMFPNLQSTALS